MKSILKNVILIFYYIIQLIILALCFWTCTSTIKIFPWYEPLTMGAYFVLMYLLPIQVLISIIPGCFSREILPKKFNIISNSTTAIIVLNLIIISLNSYLFLIFAILFSIIEFLLVIYFINILIKQFVKIRNNLKFGVERNE